MSVVYIDSSAAIKREVPESESRAVKAELGARALRGDVMVASALAWLEVSRALHRRDASEPDRRLERIFSGVDQFPLDEPVMRHARVVGSGILRTLDAIHLASAVMVGARIMMTYDDRLASAARDMGMEVLRPGD